jgi:putative SOS response-associated peptidase YedK
MCGRFELVDGERVFTRFHIVGTQPRLLDNRDVRPTTDIAAIVQDHELQLMQWWLIPSWSKTGTVDSKRPTFNARAEGIETKASFRGPLRHSRCIIPASAFFEWKGQPGHKTKYRIARKDGEYFGFAGLYDVWHDPATQHEVKSCTIITTTPNTLMQSIHTRMPVILLPEQEQDWLNPDLVEPEQIVSFLRPYPDDLLEAARVA